MQDGTFPASIKISTRCAGWRESAVNAWFDNPVPAKQGKRSATRRR
ncbi:putative DNA-binding transcriptional regulator AlpA [Sphingomonas xinjiangensis]|uniref:Putative DNA-binding transcriptional regulator AlpA n=1 Tax=Sphingomonas xinjiangensis TaxID=643568 RepID=A0A840YAT3_9SPHN|nr:putative DNA-binding transcriptional regulator AlpA [Sphingomonas xinjiangensis]